MKKQNYRAYGIVVLAAATTIACNPLNNMTKRASEVTYSVTPNPAEMHGDSVEVNISGSIPARFFNKKVSAEVTPTFQYNGVEKALKTLVLVGEDSEIEGQKINFEKGGNFSYNDKIAYEVGLHDAKLVAKAEGKYKTKSKKFDPKDIGTGTIITPMLAMNDDMPILGADKFTKVVPKEQSAVVNYMVNKSNVSSAELRDADMKELKSWVKGMADNPMFVFKGVDVVAYASPEGELSLNENLADNRANTAANSIMSMLRSAKVGAAKEEAFFNKVGKGEDWDGFKSAMQASNIKDKDLILRVLEMYEDKSKREAEIRNLAATFEELQEEILPNLRRSQITVKGDLTSFSDEQIAAFAKSNPDTLSVEELLYAATLTKDLDEKLSIYETFARINANDWRGPNNIGYIYVMQNKMEKAKESFDKANSLSPNNPVVNNNLGVYERANGNNDKALEYYNAATGAGEAVGNNIGYLNVKSGDYTSAVSNYGSLKTFNAALAQTLNGDLQTAMQTIDGSATADDAMSYYLKAVIAARMKDEAKVVSNLKTAISKDGKLKVHAKTDAEFMDYRDNAEYQAAVN